MERLLISACLIGAGCKYSGGHNALSEEALNKLRKTYILIPVCPEFSGGLPTPRDPSERLGDKVVSIKGRDVTEEYEKGAEIALKLIRRFDCKRALLKERSPSCGRDLIYDGSFTGTLTKRHGVTAEKLLNAGVEVFGESELDELLAATPIT